MRRDTLSRRLRCFFFFLMMPIALVGIDKGFQFLQGKVEYEKVEFPGILKEWSPINLKDMPEVFDVYYPGASNISVYRNQRNLSVYAVLINYFEEHQGQELVNSDNRLVTKQYDQGLQKHKLRFSGVRCGVVQFYSQKSNVVGNNIRIYSLYQVLGVVTTSPIMAKVLSIGKLFRPGSASSEIAVLVHDQNIEEIEMRILLEAFYDHLGFSKDC